jgi:hypothetical protein
MRSPFRAFSDKIYFVQKGFSMPPTVNEREEKKL